MPKKFKKAVYTLLSEMGSYGIQINKFTGISVIVNRFAMLSLVPLSSIIIHLLKARYSLLVHPVTELTLWEKTNISSV